jgi:hypothetical protein
MFPPLALVSLIPAHATQTESWPEGFFAIFSGTKKTGTLNYLRDEEWLEIPGRRVLPRRHRDTEE